MLFKLKKNHKYIVKYIIVRYYELRARSSVIVQYVTRKKDARGTILTGKLQRVQTQISLFSLSTARYIMCDRDVPTPKSSFSLL